MKTLDRIRIVLVATTHPGNIGASARAMKTMGLRKLRLVTPARFPCLEATARASGADDVLNQAEIFPTLAAAVSDCSTVVGTTARARTIAWPTLDPEACAKQLASGGTGERIALVFGREHAGLTNDEVEHCQHLVRIPTDPEFSSLNIAAAVQILAYEIRRAMVLDDGIAQTDPDVLPLATAAQMAQFYTHLEQTMQAVGFFDPQKPRRLQRRLRRLFNRAALEVTEVNIMRGFLAAVQTRCGLR